MTTTVQLADLPGLVGQEFGPSSWIEITQERINTFAEKPAVVARNIQRFYA